MSKSWIWLSALTFLFIRFMHKMKSEHQRPSPCFTDCSVPILSVVKPFPPSPPPPPDKECYTPLPPFSVTHQYHIPRALLSQKAYPLPAPLSGVVNECSFRWGSVKATIKFPFYNLSCLIVWQRTVYSLYLRKQTTLEAAEYWIQ